MRKSTALTNPWLIKGIEQASSLDHRSCLEGFHSVLNQFSKKMAAYWYQGQYYCRLVVPCCLKNTFGTSIQYLARQSVLYSQIKKCNCFHFFRHILAVIHFNFNLYRLTKTRKSDKSKRLKLTYPKFGMLKLHHISVSLPKGYHGIKFIY